MSNTNTNSEKDEFPVRVPLEGFPNQPSAGNSRPPNTINNVEHLLEESGVTVGYDVIRKRLRIKWNETDLTDSDLVSLANLNGLNSGWFLDFISAIGRHRPINPVADWINSIPWDQADRLSSLYETVEVEEDYPQTLRDQLLYRWLLSAVAAALKPEGFKTRGVLTFQGGQGIGKTSWIAALVPQEWRNEWIKLDHHLDAGNKDSILGVVAHWIAEIGELDSSFRKDVARLKGFLTNDCDKLRPPYAKSAIEMPRRTVFAATVNDPNFLVDTTGNSRWLTIPVVALNFNHTIDMQQVYAQLAVDFGKGEQWWLTQAEEAQLDELNTRHQTVSAIAERVRDRLDKNAHDPKYMTASKLLEAIGIKYPSNVQCKECGAALRSIYGPPKRVQGRDQWKVGILTEDTAFQRWNTNNEEY